MSNEFDSITPHVRCEICGVNCLVISNEIKYDCGQVFALCSDCKLATASPALIAAYYRFKKLPIKK